MDELFSKQGNEQVEGMQLSDLLDWYEKSEKGAPVNVKVGALKLPPVQRTAVWTPKQILDLWDSVLRGLPIGTFLVVERPSGELVRGVAPNSRNVEVSKGWNLLDGQQRLRALLLGTGMGCDGKLGDRQCLWIDLAGTPKTHCFALHLTSESQPFGYAPETGGKLGIDDRRKARLEIEPDEPNGHLILNAGRVAYTHELFAGFFDRTLAPLRHIEGWEDGWPPLPYKAKRGQAALFPLHRLLEAWRAAAEEDRIGQMLRVTKGAHRDALLSLNEAFGLFKAAQVALVKVKVDRDALPILFDRIGAGGTPLSTEERLFSIYKHHEPRVHDAIASIYDGGSAGPSARIGRVLPPVKIAASAIRIANALTDKGNALPDVAALAREIAGESSLMTQLSSILPVGNGAASAGRFAGAFGALFQTLAYNGRSNPKDPGIPKVMSTRLSPDLVQVLLLWIIANMLPPEAIFEARAEMIRFVLFWSFCVTNATRASNICFDIIRGRLNAGEADVPFRALSEELVKQQVAEAMPAPDEMAAFLVAGNVRPAWRSAAERFPVGGNLTEFARAWWWNGARVLEWLDRSELERSFGDFDPTSGRDDETPYDIDHILPQVGWGGNWTPVATALRNSHAMTEQELNSMRDSRFDLGNSIGNKWLVSFSDNRRWRDGHWHGEDGKLKALKDSDCFESAQAAAWTTAWGEVEPASPSGPWSRERLIAFQDVIERRAAWLYRRYYDEAGFSH